MTRKARSALPCKRWFCFHLRDSLAGFRRQCVNRIAACGPWLYLSHMRWLVTLLTFCLPIPAMAHPHVFIDTGLEFIVDDAGQLTHVRVTWAYDEFYSLLVLEDMKLDQDADGVLNDGEKHRLAGFDAQWVEGYNGDLLVAADGAPVTLSGPFEPTATTEDGRIVTSHLREVEGGAVSAAALTAKAFDETYYTAYEMTRPVTVTGPVSCQVDRVDPDIDGQLAQMQAFLLTLDADYDLEENDIPLVGENFATEIFISCPNT
ncbi:ABC-type uncharacterized transport system, periplasmic component [Ruegeria denitrificans]|uniref:ABC-type uncharacterized transport system, periplasmic component n=1 Tax=Ruegeria denitrificans TaxID=1715692 RepID=A0A0P1IGY1_9RHOB|nr:ABC-type uncharacterized transport system, periplasmic component [Ruegeria denitrificans]